MPKSVQIRHVPDDVHATLRTRATQAGVSLSDYLLEEISRIAQYPAVADVLTGAASRSGGTSAERIVEAVRDGRGT